MNSVKYRLNLFVYAGIGALLIFMLWDFGPIAQDLRYHDFADRRTLLGIPNAMDILSNIPFLLIGLAGLRLIARRPDIGSTRQSRAAWYALFASVFLVAFGSAYYHLAPGNYSLMWDRLPIGMGFMALVSIIISEFFAPRLGRLMLWPLLALGLFSVLYWYYSELQGAGDIRLYTFVQIYPLIVLPLILLACKSEQGKVSHFWWLWGAYMLAKLCEILDVPLYELTMISGHTLKHLVAAGGLFILLRGIKQQGQGNSLSRIR